MRHETNDLSRFDQTLAYSCPQEILLRFLIIMHLILIYLHPFIMPYLCRKSNLTRKPPIRGKYIQWIPQVGSFPLIKVVIYDGFPKVGSLPPIEAVIYVGFPKIGPLPPWRQLYMLDPPRWDPCRPQRQLYMLDSPRWDPCFP